MAGDSGPDATPLSLDQPVFGEHSHETLFWQAVAHLKLDPEGLVAHYLGRRTGATIAAENGATDQALMANGGWTTPAMLVRYVDPRRKIELARSALAKMP